MKHGEKTTLLHGWQEYETIKLVMRQLTGDTIMEYDVDTSDAGILAFSRADYSTT